MITELARAVGSDSALDALVSPDVGIVHRVDPGVTGYDHPRLAPTFAQVCDTRPLVGCAHAARAGAMGTDPGQSARAALGEAVERYSASFVPASRLRRARVDELAGQPCVPPDWLDPAAERNSVIRWMPATQLSAAGPGRSAWVAVSRAFLSDTDEAGRIAVPTSTGLACHSDPWRALRSALLEVIERDAVMLTWLTHAPATPIRTDGRWRTESGGEVRFDRAVERYELFRLDSPVGVPVVFAVAFGAERQPGAAVGAAASPDVVGACRKALIEAHQTFRWAAHMRAQGLAPTDPAGPFDDLDAHVAYYLDPARAEAFDFLRASDRQPQTVDLSAAGPDGDPEETCRELVAKAAAAGLDCFAVDVTSPDVRAAGLWVIRAVVPGLYPLLVGTGPRPDHPRLPARVPVNPDPHPFP